jgi:hypothetical protein
MRVRLTRVVYNPKKLGQNPLRTETVEGDLLRDIAVGESIEVLAAPIDATKTVRQVLTSPVTEFSTVLASSPNVKPKVVWATTESGSHYELEFYAES